MKRITSVHVPLTIELLAIVDMWRQGTKVRTGKLPTRSVAIRGLIKEAAEMLPSQTLQTHADMVGTQHDHATRLSALETAVAELCEAAQAAGGGE